MQPLFTLNDSVPLSTQTLSTLGIYIVHQDEGTDFAGALGPLDAREHVIRAGLLEKHGETLPKRERESRVSGAGESDQIIGYFQ